MGDTLLWTLLILKTFPPDITEGLAQRIAMYLGSIVSVASALSTEVWWMLLFSTAVTLE
jgi:hypothetical protein